ncbi:MAG TPA: hypothetical protein VGQ00_02890 [Candidatus Norongarragalinales archaeon]|nr:hypothetical protein [Candidatus Norongarragalinales archaeon]
MKKLIILRKHLMPRVQGEVRKLISRRNMRVACLVQTPLIAGIFGGFTGSAKLELKSALIGGAIGIAGGTAGLMLFHGRRIDAQTEKVTRAISKHGLIHVNHRSKYPWITQRGFHLKYPLMKVDKKGNIELLSASRSEKIIHALQKTPASHVLPFRKRAKF